MSQFKSLIAAFVLVSLLPWFGITAASAATNDVVSVVQGLNEIVGLDVRNATDPSFSGPTKMKRLAVLQSAQCGADAPMVSGIHQELAVPRDSQPFVNNPRLIQLCARAPPTSPPRLV